MAISGMRAASARLEVSAQNTANADSRGALPRSDSAPAANPVATPIPKVYRPIRANLYSLARTSDGGVAVSYQQVTPGYFELYDPQSPAADKDGMAAAPAVDPAAERLEQIQASVQYRLSIESLEAALHTQDAALDILS